MTQYNESTNEANCLLRHVCKLAGSPEQCTRNCQAWIGLHGASGAGGRISAANVPKGYRNLTLKDSPARESQSKIYATFDKYAETFERQFNPERSEAAERIKSFYLWSAQPGTGKTTSASALINEYIIAHYVGALKLGLTPQQRPAYFLSVNGLHQAHKTAYSPGAQETKDKYGETVTREVERSKQAPFLVMDDVGVRSKVSDSFIGVLYDIIDSRTTDDLPTIYTSNKPLHGAEETPSGLYDLFYDEDPEGKIVDRMRDQCAVVEFGGTSKRGRR